MSFISSMRSIGSKKHGKKSSTSSLSLTGVDDKRTQLDHLKGADRQLMSYDKPTQELGITDLVKHHEPGTRFLYAAVTGRESEDKDSRLNRLRSWKPFFNSRVESFDSLPNLKLYKESEVFPIKPLIDSLTHKKKNGLTQDYFRVVEAAVMYGAIVSSDHEFTKARISLVDNRLLGEKSVKGFIADTNKESRGDLRLSYCLPVSDAHLLSLVVSREQQFLQDGLQWGAVKIKLSIEFSDFPKQYDNMDVTATNMLTGTVLDANRTTNPDIIDISVSNPARLELARMYQSGDLVDIDEPVTNAKALKTAKSSIRDKPKGDVKSYGIGWGQMAIPRAPVDDASDDPEEDVSDTASDIERRRQLLIAHQNSQDAMRSTMQATQPKKSILKGHVSPDLTETYHRVDSGETVVDSPSQSQNGSIQTSPEPAVAQVPSKKSSKDAHVGFELNLFEDE